MRHGWNVDAFVEASDGNNDSAVGFEQAQRAAQVAGHGSVILQNVTATGTAKGVANLRQLILVIAVHNPTLSLTVVRAEDIDRSLNLLTGALDHTSAADQQE